MRSVLLASLASLSAIGVRGHPHASQGRNGLSRRAVDVDAFRIKHAAVYANVTEVQADPAIDTSPLTRRASAQDVADDLIKLTVPGATFRLAGDSYVGDNGIAHFYYKQTANGLDIDTADFNVNVDREGKVFSYGNSFYQGEIPAPPSLSKRDGAEPVNALKQAIDTLSLPVSAESATAESQQDNVFTIKKTTGCVSDPEARLVYLINQEGKLSLTWRIETDILSNWLLTYVDADTGKKVHAAIDYSADATYNVYPWGLTNPSEGKRSMVKDPEYKAASEFGWHSDGKTKWETTRGNNAAAQSNWDNEPSNLIALPRPTVKNEIYNFPYSPDTSDWKSYVNASITQLYYTSNKYHDLLHTLGFNEKAGNFELNNNNAGGLGNDFAYLNTQDGSDTDNANFATPPDGQSPRMRMYMFTSTTPWRDSSFDAGVVLHEYTHGLSNRLTGGPANSKCLSLLESGGMGEGWSDAFATAIRLRPSDTRKTNYPIGEWVTGNPKGIRQALYSTDMAVNPQVYSDADKYTRVHPIGNIWATMLYEVMWNLIDKYGKNDSDRPTFDSRGVPTDGKYLALKLFMDGMALQPCNPTFVSARDAILDADKALTAGKNQCEIWKAFAKRGLGQGAVYSASARTNSFDLPTGVC